ncbi:copper amine oxidase [Cohnella silvisoli]|uniref:Copper amine oxidase n=1 Tax=Cohnella silvisoli TaxID=2873699 RepID=A0ABV1KSG0_9BACL|nr:copper amine oxidase [Cohnella silvisoli]MCD9022672.1 copper amine oxidase [Cohnella silvisoli]
MTNLKKPLIAALAIALIGGTTTNAAGISSDSLHAQASPYRALSSISTFAGTGQFDDLNGAAATSSFRAPGSILALPDGTILISDSGNQSIKQLANGVTKDIAGVYVDKDRLGLPVGGLLDGQGDESFFNHPNGIAADDQGNIYVADTDNHAIRLIDKQGNVKTLAGNGVEGNDDGVGRAAKFHSPSDVAVAKDGTVYVADTLNNSIRAIAKDGTVSTLNAASTRKAKSSPDATVVVGDFQDGALKDAKFNEPSALALDSKGNLYVSDSGNQSIRYIDLTLGTVTTVAGIAASSSTGSLYDADPLYAQGGYADGAAAKAQFNHPTGIVATDEGGLVIADSLNHSIRYLYHGIVTTLAGDANQNSGSANGIEKNAQFNNPTDVALTADGRILVADLLNNEIRILRFAKLPVGLPANGKLSISLDGALVKVDTVLIQGTTLITTDNALKVLGITLPKVIQITKGKDKKNYVSLRAAAEQAGLDVEWDKAHNHILLRHQ